MRIAISILTLALILTGVFAVCSRYTYTSVQDWELTQSLSDEVGAILELPKGFDVERVGIWGGKDRVLFVRGVCDPVSAKTLPPRPKTLSQYDNYLFRTDALIEWFSLEKTALSTSTVLPSGARITIARPNDDGSNDFFVSVSPPPGKIYAAAPGND